VGKLNSSYKPLIVAVFLAIAGLTFGSLAKPKAGIVEVRGVHGGPSPSPVLVGVGVSVAEGAQVVDGSGSVLGQAVPLAANPEVSSVDFITAAVQDPGQPVGITFDPSGSITYTVKKGDNLSQIAQRFNVSTANIISANPSVKKVLSAGTTLTIPGGANSVLVATENSKLPDFNKNFVLPAKGYDFGILHDHNAVDIADSCGTPVVASAEGLIIPDESIPDVQDGWNGGYGNFVLIEHPFGNSIRTRYAHLEKISVQVGDYVKQGQQIGLMGQSGEATGCHVHFEVLGAQNPFAK
jgi:LysM repeat protein